MIAQWSISPNFTENGCNIVDAGNLDEEIAQVFDAENGPLISAAPDLLVAAEAAVRWEGKAVKFPTRIRDALNAAIAKARGATR